MFLRQGDCNQCGDCCGSNGEYPTQIGFESISKWPLDDVGESYSLWTLFGLGQNPQTETIEPEENEGHHRVRGTPYYYTWQELQPGKGHVPCKDTSAAHDGSAFNTECPFLQADPGNGSRPCALVGSNDEGARQKFCRPEERPEYIPENDKWTEKQKLQWENDHPNCSYTWQEIPNGDPEPPEG